MAPQDLRLSVVRASDLLVLELEFRNVEVTPPAPNTDGRIDGTNSASLIVHLQAQHIAEQAFWQVSNDHQDANSSGDETPAPPGQVQSRLSGPSRLAFDVPSGETIPLTLAGVLEALSRLPLRVSEVSRWEPPGCLDFTRLFRSPPAVSEPGSTETAIEAPYRLILSPDDQASWAHSPEPVEHDDWTELWHTRLGTAREDGDPRVRAIWSPDFNASVLQDNVDHPFRMSLDGRNRNELVHLTSNYRIPDFTPSAVETEQFMLSTLGAWLEVEGVWPDPPDLNDDNALGIVNWRHEAKMARDQYVRVVETGYLFPPCHEALFVKITERKLYYRDQNEAETPGHVAYLYQRGFIIVREPTKKYSRRDMPLREVTFKTRVTPNLFDPKTTAVPGFEGTESAFWPRVDAAGQPVDFQFHLVGEDWEGNQVEWTMPLIWIKRNVNTQTGSGGQLETVIDHYNGSPRDALFHGQGLAFAPEEKAGDTTLETVSLRWQGAEEVASEGANFRPEIVQASVNVPAVQQLTGKSDPSVVVWDEQYLSGSGSTIGNDGEVFLKVADELNAAGVEFETDKTGGMVAPDLSISGLSRALGPVGGKAADMAAGDFLPLDIFADSVKLFGGVLLSDIVADLAFNAATKTVDEIPSLVTEKFDDRIETSYSWTLAKSEMLSNDLFNPENNASLELSAKVIAPLNGDAPTTEVSGAIRDFSILLLPSPKTSLVKIVFNSVSFTAAPGESPNVKVDLKEVQFLDILEYVNRLREFIPLDGFGDGPNLEIVQSPVPGLDLGFSFGIPTIGIGVLTIQDITLSAGFYLPFGSAPLNFHFAFCERQQPFILTVSLFGGGGFFSIDVGVEGVVMLEASLEFGAAAAINLGVASGEASMMAGIYFQMAGTAFEFSAYFRAYGSLSVLGIITVSLEFYLALTYTSKASGGSYAGDLWGQASLTVKIEILFFSMSVSVSCERTFAGSDPKFRELLTSSDWEQYANAFAAHPA